MAQAMVVVATEAAVTEVAAAASVAALRVARTGGEELVVEMEVEMEMVVEAETEVDRQTDKNRQRMGSRDWLAWSRTSRRASSRCPS